MTTSSEAAAGLVSELRTIAEYVCWDKFEDRFISDPKKHPAWRAADALAARDARIAELEAAKMTAWPKKKVADLPKPSNPAEPGREAVPVAWRWKHEHNKSSDPWALSLNDVREVLGQDVVCQPLYATPPGAAREIEKLTRERDNAVRCMRDGWTALRMVREAVETLGPVGCMPSEEHVACAVAPTPFAEATAIIAGIQKIAAEAELAALKAETDARMKAAVEAEREVSRLDVVIALREWFGGERYARDYEYLDAQQGPRMKAVLEAVLSDRRARAAQADLGQEVGRG